MVVDVVLKSVESHWLRVRDEVYAMTFFRKFVAQLGGQHAATTIRWVTHHSDSHTRSLSPPPGRHDIRMSFTPYRTVTSENSFEITIKRSVFRAFIAPCRSKDEAQQVLDALRSTYWDAVHHCYAYRIGAHGLESRMSDDGEPSGSAGKPILFAMQKAKISDAIVVVVRYFGGVKLGVGPLARAYAEAAHGAIDTAVVVEVRPQQRITVHCLYDDVSTVTHLMEDVEARFEASYGDAVSFDVTVDEQKLSSFLALLISRTNGRAGYSKVRPE